MSSGYDYSGQYAPDPSADTPDPNTELADPAYINQLVSQTAPKYPIDQMLQVIRASQPGPAPVAPRQGFLDRFAEGLANIQAPGDTGNAGDVFGAHLLAGAARSFGGARTAANAAALKGQMDQYNADTATKKAEAQAQLAGLSTDYATRSKMASEAARTLATHRYAKPEKPSTDIMVTPDVAKQYPRLRGFVNQKVSRGTYEGVVAEKPEKVNPAEAQANMSAQEMARGIHEGTIPPTAIGNRATKQAMAVYAELHRLGDNLVVKQTEYSGLQKFYATQNSQQAVRARTSGATAIGALDKLQNLNDQLDKELKGLRTPIPIANKLAFDTALNTGLLGPKIASLVQKIRAQTGDATIYLQGVYGGGFAPTDPQLEQAVHNLNAYWSPEVLRGAIDLGKSNVYQRLNALNDAQALVPPGANNYQQLQPNSAGGTEGSVQWVRDPATGKLVRQ